MGLLLGAGAFDRIAPFGVLCDENLVVSRAGPAWARLRADLVGRALLEAFDVLRPDGVDGLESLRRHGSEPLLMRLRPSGPRVRFQVVDVDDPVGVVLVGAPVVSTAEELDTWGLTPDDFSPVDQTPDLLHLRAGQESSLAELRTLNIELHRTTDELRAANDLLRRAEARYRGLVEQQPLVMYIDFLGATPTADFISPRVVDWLGHPLSRWTDDPGFLYSIVHAEDRDRVRAAHLEAERDGTAFDQEFRVATADEREVWVRCVDSLVVDEDATANRRVGFMLDTTTAKAAELELRDTMSRLTTLLAHMNAGVLVEDVDHRVVMANDGLRTLFHAGDTAAELVGLPMTAAVVRLMHAGEDPAAFVRRTEELVHQRWPAVDQTLELAGSRVLEFDFAPIVAAGHELGAMWVFRDATDRVRYQDALARARDEAIASSDAKSDFLASMSHEIRTPMHGVLATVDLLRTTPLEPDQRELVDVMTASAQSLVQIIDDILDLSKVEAGHIELAAEPFDLSEVLCGVADLLGTQARAKGLTLSVVTDPAIPAVVVGDGPRLRQVLVNLVGNAVKFTSVGSVALEARLARRRASDVVVELEVRDSGCGIPADRLAAVFDPFVQARRGHEGTGLGLAIADRLVTLMGGRIEVVSEVDVGSTFRFQVRLDEPCSGREDAAARGPLVLVVDGAAPSRGLAQRLLARLGVSARAVASGTEALRALDESPGYGLVLVDVDLPDLDGPATARLIRASRERRIAAVPVFAMIAGADVTTLDRCRDSGMDGHVSKPVEIVELRRLLETVVGVPAR